MLSKKRIADLLKENAKLKAEYADAVGPYRDHQDGELTDIELVELAVEGAIEGIDDAFRVEALRKAIQDAMGRVDASVELDTGYSAKVACRLDKAITAAYRVLERALAANPESADKPLWRPGDTFGNEQHYVGDRFVVVVQVRDTRDGSVERELTTIVTTEDGYETTDGPWGWGASSIEWWMPIAEAGKLLPADKPVEDGGRLVPPPTKQHSVRATIQYTGQEPPRISNAAISDPFDNDTETGEES